MAVHFGADGKPNGWATRGSFVALDLGITGLLAVVFLGISLVSRSVKSESVNLPNKEYWMAPERRGQTVDFLARAFLWFGAATMLLMLDVFGQVFRFNLSPSRGLAHPAASLAVYVCAALAWVAVFFRRFARK
jgi:uncharacterized membrane protein